ncbi:hypothetical protein LLH03_05235 [bacterium]|nr:hypothetical protein [bacterium]
MGLLLAAAVLGFGFLFTTLQTSIGRKNQELADATKLADEVRKLESEVSAKKGRLQPIADKVAFIDQADECGYPYFDRMYKILEFIYGGAELRFFGIMAHNSGGLVGDGSREALYHVGGPAGSVDCAFGVRIKNTNEFGRFILNLIRCPEITDVRISGAVPAGRVVAARWPQILQQWNLPYFGIPTGALQGLSLGGGGGAQGAAGGAPEGGMPTGAEAGSPSEASGMPTEPGAGGGPAAMGGAAAMQALSVQPALDGSIDVLVTCQLVHPIMVPQPASGAAAAPAGGPGGAPGGAPAGAGGPPGGAPPGGEAGAAAPGAEEPGASGGGKAGGGGGGEEKGGGGGLGKGGGADAGAGEE